MSPAPPWTASSVREPTRDVSADGEFSPRPSAGIGHGWDGLAAALEDAGMPVGSVHPWLDRCRAMAVLDVQAEPRAFVDAAGSGPPTWSDLQGELARLDRTMRAEVLSTFVRRSLRRVRGSVAATLLESLLPLAAGTDERLGAGLEVEASRPPMVLAEVLAGGVSSDPRPWLAAVDCRGRLGHLRLAEALASGLRPGFDSSLVAFEVAFVGASASGVAPAGLRALGRTCVGSSAGEIAGRDQLARLEVAVAPLAGPSSAGARSAPS